MYLDMAWDAVDRAMDDRTLIVTRYWRYMCYEVVCEDLGPQVWRTTALGLVDEPVLATAAKPKF